MKRLISLILSLSILLSLSACGRKQSEPDDQTCFYYCRKEYDYGTEDAVIASEQRDISGRTGDYHYLLTLYLMGPAVEDLRSPFPSTVRLISAEAGNGNMTVKLTGGTESLSDAELTLACACMAKTCFEISGADSVTIIMGESSITLEQDMLLLYDDAIPSETSMEDEQ